MEELQPVEPEKEKITFPRIFDQCPNCGSQVRLATAAIQQLKDAGTVHKDSFNTGLMHQIPLLDQAHPPTILGPQIKIPMLLIYWDVCECGTMYCTKFEVIQAPAQVEMQQPAPPHGFRGFNPPTHRRN